MDFNVLEKDSRALGGLFQAIVNDMKVGRWWPGGRYVDLSVGVVPLRLVDPSEGWANGIERTG